MQLKRALADNAKQTKVLAYITALKKLCNHPKVKLIASSICV